MCDIGREVEILKPKDLIEECLSRIGIANRTERKLFPSCYLINEEGKYYIAHFKELLKVNGSCPEDLIRRNTVVWLLQYWNYINIIDIITPQEIQKKRLFILSREQLQNEKWEIVHKWHSHKTEEEVK